MGQYQINPENLAYWYFRLNGFFTITNFIVHPEMGIGQRTDVDIFGVRFPYRQELLYSPMEDEFIFTRFQKPYIIIAEVKTDRCSLNGPWTNSHLGNMQRVLRSFGALCPDNIDAIADQLYRN